MTKEKFPYGTYQEERMKFSSNTYIASHSIKLEEEMKKMKHGSLQSAKIFSWCNISCEGKTILQSTMHKTEYSLNCLLKMESCLLNEKSDNASY